MLEQERDGKWHPVAFMSRKLAKGPARNWSPREKETFAVISALRKWAGWIGYQQVVVLTDHRALESWVSEFVDTPSGPAGRRARWHELLSRFNIEVKYIPAKDNVVADTMSPWAYPASQALGDVSSAGSVEDHKEVREIIEKEGGKKKASLPSFKPKRRGTPW